jgi:hypothetical protein
MNIDERDHPTLDLLIGRTMDIIDSCEHRSRKIMIDRNRASRSFSCTRQSSLMTSYHWKSSARTCQWFVRLRMSNTREDLVLIGLDANERKKTSQPIKNENEEYKWRITTEKKREEKRREEKRRKKKLNEKKALYSLLPLITSRLYRFLNGYYHKLITLLRWQRNRIDHSIDWLSLISSGRSNSF